ncbi:MAG TPA: hypothetical protein VII43_01650 [Opitutaceae bacterium]
MKARSKIELLAVTGILLKKFWDTQALVCMNCTPSAVIFGGFTVLLILALFQRPAWLAFLLGVIGLASSVSLGKTFCSASHSHSLASDLLFTGAELVYLVFAFCLLDLWFEWRRPEAPSRATV